MSLFSSKEPSKATSNITVQKTGRNIDDMLQALIEGANDKDEGVRTTISDSLGDIGRFEPELMLSMCAAFLERNAKVRKLKNFNFLFYWQRNFLWCLFFTLFRSQSLFLSPLH